MVEITDDCDPASFNLAIGPGTCVGHGETIFADFVAEVAKEKAADDWAFDPEELSVAPGQSITLHNAGGELHTFTKVAAFGGGFVQFLNDLSGNPVPVPEATSPPGPSNLFLPAGSTATVDSSVLTPGTNRFQCLVHPWMRTVVDVTTPEAD